MSAKVIENKEQLVMKLVHYFITNEDYKPVIVQGVKDEIWLENLGAPYKVIRINTNYIHNEEQLEYDFLKTKHIMKQIKKKTLSLKFKVLNINLDVKENISEKSDKAIKGIHAKDIKDLKNNDFFKKTFPEISKNLLMPSNKLDVFFQATKEIEEKTKEENKVFDSIFKTKPIIVTYILIALSIFVFSLTYLFGNGSEDAQTLLVFGANYAPLIKDGEVWRLLTSTFLHAGIFHLVVNMYALYILGTQLETFVGKTKFITIYFISGLMGSLFSVLLGGGSLSVGASGAIFGLAGALLYFGLRFRLYLGNALRNQILPIILINLLIGFMIPAIDVAAHAGGLIAGYLTTAALGIKARENEKEKISSWISLTLLFIFVIYLIFF